MRSSQTETRWDLTKFTKQSPKNSRGPRPLTCCTSTGALALRSSWTTSAWPSFAAQCSGVQPQSGAHPVEGALQPGCAITYTDINCASEYLPPKVRYQIAGVHVCVSKPLSYYVIFAAHLIWIDLDWPKSTSSINVSSLPHLIHHLQCVDALHRYCVQKKHGLHG